MTKREKRGYWLEIDTGRVVTFREMCAVLETEYGFDEWTPISEAYDYFVPFEDRRNWGIQ